MRESWWVKSEQLDADQKKIIELPIGGNHLILGPPGSGKTNLLLLRANWHSLMEQKNILILLFTKTLQSFMQTGAAEYAFASERVKTYHKWAAGFLFENDIRIDHGENDDFEESRSKMGDAIRTFIDERKIEPQYDVILVDEAQDFFSQEIELLCKLGRNIFAVADARQKIYQTDESIELLKRKCNVQELKFHYRNGVEICKAADAVALSSESMQSGYKKLATTSNYNEVKYPSAVHFKKYANLDEQYQDLLKNIGPQLKAYPDELIGIICPKAEDAQAIRAKLELSPLSKKMVSTESPGGPLVFEDGKCILVCTVHASKGLEFRTVHVLGAENISRFPVQKKMAYMAITRAKTTLHVYYTGNLPHYLEDALRRPASVKGIPSIDEVFRGSK